MLLVLLAATSSKSVDPAGIIIGLLICGLLGSVIGRPRGRAVLGFLIGMVPILGWYIVRRLPPTPEVLANIERRLALSVVDPRRGPPGAQFGPNVHMQQPAPPAGNTAPPPPPPPPSPPASSSPSGPASETTKQCPHCAETIKAAAVFCRFCRQDVGNTVR